MLGALLLCASSVLAQGAFIRDDSFDFRGIHHFSVHGQDENHLFTDLGTSSDFSLFKIHLKTGGNLGPNPTNTWWLNKIEMDIDNNGTIDGVVQHSGLSEHTFTHAFPEPLNGLREDHTIRFKLQFLNQQSGLTERTVYETITNY